MKVFVTGANGFIGSNLVKGLVKNGHSVISLVLPGTSAASIEKLNTRIVYGNILEPEGFSEYLEGVDVVYHLAAKVSDWGDASEFFSVNVEGTRLLLKACAVRGVKRFVFMSSLAIHSPRGYVDADETAPRDNFSMPYAKSKIEGENLVMEFHERGKLEGVIIRPGFFPYGPGDMTSFYHMARAMEKGFYGYVKGGVAYLCTSYVENLVEGLILAGERAEAAGEVFVMSDNFKITWRELGEKMARSLSVKEPSWSIPMWLGLTLAGAFEVIYRTFRITSAPPVTRYRVYVAGTDYHFISRKAEKMLGYRPAISLDEGLKRTVEWYKGVKQIQKDL